MSVSSSHQSVGAVSLSLVVKVKATFFGRWKWMIPQLLLHLLGVTSCAQTEEQVDAGSNVSKNVQRI